MTTSHFESQLQIFSTCISNCRGNIVLFYEISRWSINHSMIYVQLQHIRNILTDIDKSSVISSRTAACVNSQGVQSGMQMGEENFLGSQPCFKGNTQTHICKIFSKKAKPFRGGECHMSPPPNFQCHKQLSAKLFTYNMNHGSYIYMLRGYYMLSKDNVIIL